MVPDPLRAVAASVRLACSSAMKSESYSRLGPLSQGSAEQILVERVAGKIGMIIRRATRVVAGTTVPGSATQWLPGAWHEETCETAIGQRWDARVRQNIHGAPAALYGVASSSGRNCSALRGRTIRIVAFRASHPANPPPRQRRFIQRFPSPGRSARLVFSIFQTKKSGQLPDSGSICRAMSPLPPAESGVPVRG